MRCTRCDEPTDHRLHGAAVCPGCLRLANAMFEAAWDMIERDLPHLLLEPCPKCGTIRAERTE